MGDGGCGGSVRIGVVVPGRAYLKSIMVVLGFSGSTADRRTRRSTRAKKVKLLEKVFLL